jgi:hypothetical protein
VWNARLVRCRIPASTKGQTRREARAQSPRAFPSGRRPGRRREPTSPERSLVLVLTLIAAELSCALLGELTVAVAACAVALLLGCGLVLAAYL